MKIISKLVDAIAGTKEVEAVQLWEVRWYSFHYAFADGDPDMVDAKEEVDAFPTKTAAEEFARSLNTARRLLKDDTEGRGLVTLRKGTSNRT